MKKVSLTIVPLIVCACLLGGSPQDGGLQSVVSVPPRQSELLKAMEIMPEDITSVIILDDRFTEFPFPSR